MIKHVLSDSYLTAVSVWLQCKRLSDLMFFVVRGSLIVWELIVVMWFFWSQTIRLNVIGDVRPYDRFLKALKFNRCTWFVTQENILVLKKERKFRFDCNFLLRVSFLTKNVIIKSSFFIYRQKNPYPWLGVEKIKVCFD